MVTFAKDRSEVPDLVTHLKRCADSFFPPLHETVDIELYASKLEARATTFEAWTELDLVGLVAIYLNAPSTRTAFVTNVSVVPELSGRGLARTLMESAIECAVSTGFRTVELEVARAATRARRLYSGLGFQEVGEPSNQSVKMTLKLSEN